MTSKYNKKNEAQIAVKKLIKIASCGVRQVVVKHYGMLSSLLICDE